MRAVVALSLKFRVLVVGAALVAAVVGAFQLRRAPVDALPEFNPPLVQIQTEAPGLSAAEVEQLITVPLEQDLLNGVAWLAHMRSDSEPGLSSIDLVFQPGTDLLKARQAVQERLTQARALPNVGTPPVMVQPLSSQSRAMMIGLSSKDLSVVDLSVLARWKIRPRLMAVPGVANVLLWGQADRQLQVDVDPAKLREHGVSLDQVISTAGDALWVSPLGFLEASTPGTGGFVDTPNQRFAIQHVLPITTAADLGSVTIEDTGGRALRLSDVSTVVEDHQPLIGDAVLFGGSGGGTASGGPGLMLVVQKFPGADTRQVAAAVGAALDSLRPGLGGITIDTSVYRPDGYLNTSVRDVGVWVLASLVLLAALVTGFLASWRAALVALAGIAVAEISALSVLQLAGATFNLMVLAGLTAALGVVVGDALGGPSPYPSAIILVAPAPVYFAGGWASSLAKPLVSAYALAVAVSLLVALAVTPALSSLLLRSGRSAPGGGPLPEDYQDPEGLAATRREGPAMAAVRRGFDVIARVVIPRPWRVALVAVVVAGAGLAVLPQLNGRTLIPSAQDRTLLIHVHTAAGTSLAETTRITSAVGAAVRALPGVDDVGAHMGRAVTGDQAVDVNAGELWVTVDGSADYGATVAAVDRTLGAYPGIGTDRADYTQDQLDAVRAESGSTAPVLVRVYGQDLPTLQAQAEKVRAAIATVPGVARPQVQSLAVQPTLQVEVNLAAAQKYGVKPGDVRRTATTYFSGLNVGSYYQDQRVFDVVVWGTPRLRADPADLGSLLIATPSGDQVPLGEIAQVKTVPYPTVIRHDASSRSLDVTAQVSGRDLVSVLGDVKARVAGLAMPLEFHAEVFSDVARQQGADLRLLWIVCAVLTVVLLLLHAAFGSWRAAAVVLPALLLAGGGGAVTAPAAGGAWSLGGLLGFAAVFAVAVRVVVPLVQRYQHEQPVPDGPTGAGLVLDLTRRQAPLVALTLLGLGAAMLPVLGIGRVAGLEVLFPFAVVVLGGLVTTALVALVLVPALFARLAPAGRAAAAEETRLAASAD